MLTFFTSESRIYIKMYLFVGNESHEYVITDCGGGNIGTWWIKLGVAKFLPVLKCDNEEEFN